MVPFRSDITIQRPVQEVFEYVADPKNYASWMGGVTGVQPTADALIRGSQVRMEGRMGFWNLSEPMEITAYEPPRAFGMQGLVGPLFFDGKWEFEPVGASATHLTVSGNFSMSGLWRVAEPLFAGEVKNGEAKELSKIKAQLEARS